MKSDREILGNVTYAIVMPIIWGVSFAGWWHERGERLAYEWIGRRLGWEPLDGDFDDEMPSAGTSGFGLRRLDTPTEDEDEWLM